MRRVGPLRALRAIPRSAFQSRSKSHSEYATNGSGNWSWDRPTVCLKPKQGRKRPSPVFERSIPSGDRDRALTKASRVYDHPNAQVRLKAVKATLAVAPERARDAC